jgi:stearoyl-CoA desaturase (delta-9 desaturase)
MSRNVWWVALLSFGEGWHNNHHALPQSARFGLHRGEFDFTWETLVMLKRLGLVTDIRLPKTTKVEAAGRVPLEVS